MSAKNGSSKADTLVKLVLVFFISLLSFSIGTFVGKQFSDSDHRRMALEGEYGSGRTVASTDLPGEAGIEQGEKISDKEVESLTEEFVNKEKAASAASEAEAQSLAGHSATADTAAAATTSDDGYKSYSRGAPRQPSSAATAEAAAPAPSAKPARPSNMAAKHPSGAPNVVMGHKPASTAPATTSDGIASTADKVAHDEAPTDGMNEAKKVMPTLPSVASSAVGKFTVQVSSYTEEKEAKEHAATLKGKGWNAFYLPATVGSKTWYRVLVGLFNNDKSAKEFRTQFMKETNTKSAIVQKIIQ